MMMMMTTMMLLLLLPKRSLSVLEAVDETPRSASEKATVDWEVADWHPYY